MLSKNMINKLNDQIALETFSVNLYLQMSAWCLSKAYVGCAKFLKSNSMKEEEHKLRLYDYVNKTGAMTVLSEVKAPEINYISISDVFTKTYAHEAMVTKDINNLVNLSLEEKDFSTFNFLQWYVAEQHEEEHLLSTILDKIKIIGTDPKNLFFLDREIGSIEIK